ncbi:MAG: tRNA pseudouridine(55) synthase TruB [Sinobacteraceae bacterium]|nr:tRNA pseudouridine(55) synthase TruB [Nevskiaceae bacterium]
MDTVNGIFLLDKPAGLSSNGALQRVRRLLRARKAGHVGSLDPLATGMLPICLGEATKVAGDMLSGRKLYRFDLQLGSRTTTGDVEGEELESAPVPALSAAVIERTLQHFTGAQQQVPPMYSALKRDGQPLYRLARAGIQVERAPRNIEIYVLKLRGEPDNPLKLEVLCSKGTYVRTLGEDLALALGTVGHLVQLRRASVEPFSEDAMQSLEELERQLSAGRSAQLLPADTGLQHLPAVQLDAAQARRLLHGQSVAVDSATACGRVRLYGPQHTFLGMGESDLQHRVHPRRLFAAADVP